MKVKIIFFLLLCANQLQAAVVFCQVTMGIGTGTLVAIDQGDEKPLSFKAIDESPLVRHPETGRIIPHPNGPKMMFISEGVATDSGVMSKNIERVVWYDPKEDVFYSLKLNLPGQITSPGELTIGPEGKFTYSNAGFPIQPSKPTRLTWELISK